VTTPSSIEFNERDTLGDQVFKLLDRLDFLNHGVLNVRICVKSLGIRAARDVTVAVRRCRIGSVDNGSGVVGRDFNMG
jgi:hypothetical protein